VFCRSTVEINNTQSRQEQPKTAKDSQEQPGAARSSQEQPKKLKMNTAHAQEDTLPKSQLGAGEMQMHDENEHRARTGGPTHSDTFQSVHMVREWRTFNESEHHARMGAPMHYTADFWQPHLGLSTPPELLKLKLFGELLALLMALILLLSWSAR
jgi:hypothetical protein